MQYTFDDKLHAHTLDGVALTGTSSIGDVLAKPLTWWASGLAVAKLGWIKKLDTRKSTKEEVAENAITRIRSASDMLKRLVGMHTEEYLGLLDEAYKAHSVKLKDTAQAGTDLHYELEKFVKDQMKGVVGEAYPDQIKPFTDWSKKEVKKFLWSEAHCFDEELFVGGITDCGAELNDGKLVVIDFKSSKEVYLTAFMQTAGYAIQVEKNGLWDKDGTVNKKLEGKIEGLIVVPFGAEIVEPVISYDVENLKDGFRHAVALYRLLGMGKNQK